MRDLSGVKTWHIIGLLIAFRLWFSGEVGLAADEAYYWVWSERLAWGYLDHPPAIVGLIKWGTTLVGDNEKGVRLIPIVVGAIPLWVASRLSKDPMLAVVLVGFLPLFALGGLLATPDVPLVAAWALAIWARVEHRWVVLGLAIGAAMLSKYTGLLLLLLLVMDPVLLRTPRPWVAAGVAFAVYLPNVIWNLQNEAVSWRFQFSHATEGGDPATFLAAQIGLVGGFLFLPFARFWMRGWRTDPVLWWSSAPLMVLGIAAGGEANWAAPALLGPAIAVSSFTGRWKRVVSGGVGVALVLTSLVFVHAKSPLFFHPKDPLHRLRGGQVLGDAVKAWGIDHVLTRRYQDAAVIHFYSGIPAHAIPELGRVDQYDLWPFGFPDEALFVRVHDPRPGVVTSNWYTHQDGPHVVSGYASTPDPLVSHPVRKWQVYKVWNE